MKYYHQLHRSHSGFTIIELLVVMSIIALLSSALLVSLNTARKKTRDTVRKSDLKQLEIALEMNFNAKGAYTQEENCGSDTSFTGCDNNATGAWGANSDLLDLVSQGYISILPKDPVNNATYKYSYEVGNAGEAGYVLPGMMYDLCATLEMGGSFCISKRN